VNGRVAPRRRREYNGAVRLERIAVLAGAALLGLGATGCASVEGARLYGRGSEALARGDAAAAVADLERAAALVPHASEIQNHLGLAYGQAGREADALAAFRRAVALDCDNEAAQRNLRAAEARTGAAGDEAVPVAGSGAP
jgi:Flp pilus assembly protein TadD